MGGFPGSRAARGTLVGEGANFPEAIAIHVGRALRVQTNAESKRGDKGGVKISRDSVKFWANTIKRHVLVWQLQRILYCFYELTTGKRQSRFKEMVICWIFVINLAKGSVQLATF